MINYITYKNENSNEWVTFVHGAGGSSSIWFKQIRDFKKQYNVLLLDLRGHGDSKKQIKKAFQQKLQKCFAFLSNQKELVRPHPRGTMELFLIPPEIYFQKKGLNKLNV